MKPRMFGLIGVVAVTGLFPEAYVQHALADPQCAENSSETERVCVEWGQQTDPIELTDFTVDYECTGCGTDPKVVLMTGDDGWVVWSEVIGSRVPANIGALTTTDSDNYVVKIAKGTGPGAASVGVIRGVIQGTHTLIVDTGCVVWSARGVGM